MAFSPDGSRVLTGSDNRTAKLWQATNGALLQTFQASGRVTSVAFSPDGSRVAAGTDDNTAEVWSGLDGTPLRLRGHTGWITSVAFSPDGNRVLTGSYDCTAKLWSAADGTPLRTLQGHTDWVTSVAFTPDGTKALTGSRDGTVLLWQADGITLLNPVVRMLGGTPQFHFLVNSQPGRTVEFLKSTDVLNWTVIGSSLNSNGLLDFYDATKEFPRAFYRARYMQGNWTRAR